MFLLFLIFLVSEGLLFVSFFWTSFHSLSSPTLGISQREGFYLPDPCELTFANTILLSNAAISLGNAFISLEISSQFVTKQLFSFNFLFSLIFFLSVFKIYYLWWRTRLYSVYRINLPQLSVRSWQTIQSPAEKNMKSKD